MTYTSQNSNNGHSLTKGQGHFQNASKITFYTFTHQIHKSRNHEFITHSYKTLFNIYQDMGILTKRAETSM